MGYWTFDGSATNWRTNTTADISGNGNTGSLNSLATSTAPKAGKIGQALYFNGVSSYVNLTQSTLPIYRTTGYSVSAWYKVPGPDSANNSNIFSEGNAAAIAFGTYS